MKIIVITAYAPFGTDDAYYIEELLEMKRQGHALLIVPCAPRRACGSKDAQPLLSDAVREPLLSFNVFWGAFREMAGSPIRALRLLLLARQSRTATHLVKNLGMYVRGLWLGRLAREFGAEHIHACNGTSCATKALFAAGWTGIPWSFTAHRHDIVVDNLFRLKVDQAAWVRFISEWGLEYACENLLGGARPGKAFVLHMGVSMPPNPARLPGENMIALCPARLIPLKGQRYLIEAMSLLRQKQVPLRLWLAGEGGDADALRALVETLGLSGMVRFLGHVAHEELLDLYKDRRISFVVLPSMIEGIPVSLMEAMSYGVPVIATAVGGTPELLREGAGILVPAEDPRSLAEAMERLCRNPDEAARLSKAGRARVQDGFHCERIIHELTGRFLGASRAAGRV